VKVDYLATQCLVSIHVTVSVIRIIML